MYQLLSKTPVLAEEVLISTATSTRRASHGVRNGPNRPNPKHEQAGTNAKLLSELGVLEHLGGLGSNDVEPEVVDQVQHVVEPGELARVSTDDGDSGGYPS